MSADCPKCGKPYTDHARDGACPDACPAWADGQHCYSDWSMALGQPFELKAKRCACGKTVERKP